MMVYPNFAKCLKESADWFKERGIPGIPDSWVKFVNLDHGLRNPTAVYWSAIDPDRNLVVTYDEYYKPGLVPDHAPVIKPKIDAISSGRLQFMVADPSIRNKTDPINGKSVQSIYQEYGLYFSEGNNSLDMGLMKVNSYINRGKWVILKDKCPNLAREGIGYKYPELSMDDKKNPDEKPEKKNDHAMDSMRYGFARLPDDPDQLKTIAGEPPKKYTKEDEDSVYDDEYDDEYENGRDYLSYV